MAKKSKTTPVQAELWNPHSLIRQATQFRWIYTARFPQDAVVVYAAVFACCGQDGVARVDLTVLSVEIGTDLKKIKSSLTRLSNRGWLRDLTYLTDTKIETKFGWTEEHDRASAGGLELFFAVPDRDAYEREYNEVLTGEALAREQAFDDPDVGPDAEEDLDADTDVLDNATDNSGDLL